MKFKDSCSLPCNLFHLSLLIFTPVLGAPSALPAVEAAVAAALAASSVLVAAVAAAAAALVPPVLSETAEADVEAAPSAVVVFVAFEVHWKALEHAVDLATVEEQEQQPGLVSGRVPGEELLKERLESWDLLVARVLSVVTLASYPDSFRVGRMAWSNSDHPPGAICFASAQQSPWLLDTCSGSNR